MSAPVLSFRHVFGFKADVSCPLLYLDDATVVYAAGHQVVLHNTATKQQRVIPATSAAPSPLPSPPLPSPLSSFPHSSHLPLFPWLCVVQ